MRERPLVKRFSTPGEDAWSAISDTMDEDFGIRVAEKP
jgi:hypothetical protein